MVFGEKNEWNNEKDNNKEKKEVQNIQKKTQQELDGLKKTVNETMKNSPYFSDPYYQKASEQIGNWPYGKTPEASIKAYAQKLKAKAEWYVQADELWIIASVWNTFFDGLPIETYNNFVKLYYKRPNGQMTKEEIAFKDNIAQKIFPWGYGVMDKLEEFTDNTKKYTKENVQKMKLPMQIRIDMFRKYLWLEQYTNSIIESEYKPSKSSEKTKYYDFNPMLRKKIIIDIKKRLWTNISFDEFTEHVKEKNNQKTSPLGWMYENMGSGTIQQIPSQILGQLGHHKAWIWFDNQKKEKYVSYYDIRDLDPDILKANNMNLDTYNFPFEIYGRIYESDFNRVK
jgi:hypothetical protein